MSKKKTGRPIKLDRNLKICELAYNGRTPSDIGKEFNLSRSRVSHIIEDYWKPYIKQKRDKQKP